MKWNYFFKYQGAIGFTFFISAMILAVLYAVL